MESVTETARILLTVAILSGVALSAFVWRLTRPSREPHERLVSQLHLSQWAALLLAAAGAVGIGQGVTAAAAPGAMVEASTGILALIVAAVVLRREPEQALLLAGGCLLLHGLFDWAHRTPLLTAAFVPDWWSVGSAIYDAYIAVLCVVAVLPRRE